jgi:hypothetical protein
MPWKVALEFNRALIPGGLVYTATHQTFPVHEVPSDFWRFSSYTWPTIFNTETGFEVIEAVMGEPARIHPRRSSPVTRDTPSCPAFLGSASLVKKIGETRLSWPVRVTSVTASMYPSGELATAPTSDPT